MKKIRNGGGEDMRTEGRKSGTADEEDFEEAGMKSGMADEEAFEESGRAEEILLRKQEGNEEGRRRGHEEGRMLY